MDTLVDDVGCGLAARKDFKRTIDCGSLGQEKNKEKKRSEVGAELIPESKTILLENILLEISRKLPEMVL